MLSPKDVTDMDAACAAIVEKWPNVLRSFYANCIAAGFDIGQATALTLELLKGMVSRGTGS